MIGERIRQARLVAGLTLDETVERLAKFGVSISKQGLSNYERNKRAPRGSVLMALAAALGVKTDYFAGESDATIVWSAYRCQASLRKRQKEEIQAVAQSLAERYIALQSTLFPGWKPAFPPPMKVWSAEDAETAADKLRLKWRLGTGALESVTQTIESKGAVLVECPMAGVRFDGLSGWINGASPLLVVNSSVPTDRKRFNLAHELGHLVLDCGNTEPKEQERTVHRFAGAFLLPADAVRMELGAQRCTIDLKELALLKQRYGLSMAGIIHRVQELGIVSGAESKRIWVMFSKRGWRKKEPVEYKGNEQPTRLRQMVMRALAEGIITEERAREYEPQALPAADPIERDRESAAPEARALLALPRTERLRLLERAAAEAQSPYGGDPDQAAWAELGVKDLHE